MKKCFKSTKSIYLLFLGVTILISLYTKSKPGVAIFVISDKLYDNITTTSNTYQYNTKYISVYQSIPHINGLTDPYFQKSLNLKILKKSKQNQKNIINISKNYNKTSIRYKLPLVKFEYTESFSVIPSIKPYYNIAFFEYNYSGGAHGSSFIQHTVIDTQTNTIIKLKDLFKPNIDYLSILNQEVRLKIESLYNVDKIPIYIYPNKISLSTEQDFYINKKGDIVLVFNEYEIAPYSAGIIEVNIPISNIAMYIKYNCQSL